MPVVEKIEQGFIRAGEKISSLVKGYSKEDLEREKRIASGDITSHDRQRFKEQRIKELRRIYTGRIERHLILTNDRYINPKEQSFGGQILQDIEDEFIREIELTRGLSDTWIDNRLIGTAKTRLEHWSRSKPKNLVSFKPQKPIL